MTLMGLERTMQRLAAIAPALVLLVGCEPNTVPMTPDETQLVARITENATTRCVGRHLVELPTKFVLNTEWFAEVEGVKVDVRPMKKPDFDRALSSHMDWMERTRLPKSGLPYLRSAVTTDSGVLFDRTDSTASTGRAQRILEAWGWRDGYRLQASIAAFDGTFPEDSDSKFHREIGSDVHEKSTLLMSVYNRLSGRAETEVPKVQGFCIANGFVVGPPGDSENVSIAFHLDGAPDVFFNVSEPGENVKERERLLERSAKVEAEMKLSGTQTIRKGVVKHGGMDFDEWLFKGPTHDRVPGTMFVQVGNESKPGRQFPFVRLELFNGFRIPAPERTPEESAQLQELKRATLSEAEAIAVWDKVAPTLRLRPGAL